jgi:hypothetical protein
LLITNTLTMPFCIKITAPKGGYERRIIMKLNLDCVRDVLLTVENLSTLNDKYRFEDIPISDISEQLRDSETHHRGLGSRQEKAC